jgi:aspartyl-tRNA synthetase
MERFGSDKPDTRFGFELKLLNDVVKDSEFQVFANALAAGGDVRGINIEGAAEKFSRKDIDKLQDAIKHFGAKDWFGSRSAKQKPHPRSANSLRG